MCKLGIAVVSFDRPKHLYVTLDSIFKANQIDQVQVYAFLIENDTLDERISIIDDLPIQKVIIKQRGGDAFMEALHNLFYIQKCDQVLLFCDDQIVSTELLEYVNILIDDNPIVFIDALGCSENTLDISLGIDMCGGTRWLKSSFDLLQAWLDTDECIRALGIYYAPYSNYRYDFDYFTLQFMNSRGYYTRYSPKRYGMCFGVCGIHGTNTPECHDFENNRFFVGNKEIWLSNIAKILASDEELSYDITHALLPRHYIYR